MDSRKKGGGKPPPALQPAGGSERRAEGLEGPAHADPAGPATPALPFPWMRVLWLKGLTHSNPHVQRMAAAALLSRAWASEAPGAAAYLRSVPAAFLAGDLLPALGQPHVHRGEAGAATATAAAGASVAGDGPGSGAGGSGSSGSGQREEEHSAVTAQAVLLVRRYCAVAGPAARGELLRRLLDQLAGRDPTRMLLLVGVKLSKAVGEAIAAEQGVLSAEKEPEAPATAGSGGGWAAELVALLRAAVKGCAGFGTSTFALGVYAGAPALLRCCWGAGLGAMHWALDEACARLGWPGKPSVQCSKLQPPIAVFGLCCQLPAAPLTPHAPLPLLPCLPCCRAGASRRQRGAGRAARRPAPAGPAPYRPAAGACPGGRAPARPAGRSAHRCWRAWSLAWRAAAAASRQQPPMQRSSA